MESRIIIYKEHTEFFLPTVRIRKNQNIIPHIFSNFLISKYFIFNIWPENFSQSFWILQLDIKFSPFLYYSIWPI